MGQLIGIAGMGKAMLDAIHYQRLLPRLAILVMLAVVTGVLAGLLAAGLFYTAYLLLVHYGLDATVALAVTGMGIVAATFMCAMLTLSYAKRLRQVLQPFSPLASGMADIAGAFMDGLRTSHKHIRKL